MALYRNMTFSTRLRLLQPEPANHSFRPSLRTDRIFRFPSLSPGDRIEDG